ncbi:HVO_A0114 family putative DNA-binding protein [Aeromonas veronii]
MCKSIRTLADHLERDVNDVHNDLHSLIEYGIIHFAEIPDGDG